MFGEFHEFDFHSGFDLANTILKGVNVRRRPCVSHLQCLRLNEFQVKGNFTMTKKKSGHLLNNPPQTQHCRFEILPCLGCMTVVRCVK